MEDDIQSWWEIPSIVHFCKVFSPVCKDLFPVNITEFERAVELNSSLLTNMAVRFIKICGFYDPQSSFKWWTVMKQHFKDKYIEYNFKYFLDSVDHFDYLTRKQKVEALYILCHIILDVKEFQDNISLRPEIWNKLNVKPIGFDLNKSLYWYFGSTRLYREDFEDPIDLSSNSSTLNNTTQFSNSVSSNNSNSSNIDSCEEFSSELSSFGHFRSGKWHIICNDNNETWYSLADITENSKNINIRSLHRSICKIIKKLPQIKRNKSHYIYLKSPQSKSFLKHNIQTRSLSNMHIDETEFKIIGANSEVSIKEQCSQNDNLMKNYDLSLNSQSNKKENNTDIFDQNYVIPNTTNIFDNEKVEESTSETKRKLRSSINSECYKSIKKNDHDPSKDNSNFLLYGIGVNVERYDQENTQKFDNFRQKLRTSKRFKTETKIPPFKDLNC